MTILNKELNKFLVDSLNWVSELGGNFDELDNETFEVTKNDQKTTIKMFFNKKGIPVKQEVTTEEIVMKISEMEIKEKEASARMDYEEAIKWRDKIRKAKGSQ